MTLRIFSTILMFLSPVLSVPIVDVEHIDGVVLRTVQWGTTVILKCLSNDPTHIFEFWHIINKGVVIGPGNEFDPAKYRYEVLSGNLTIKAVSKYEEGLYECVSKDIKGTENRNIKTVRMIVQNSWDKVYEDDYNINLIRILVALITVVIISMGAWFAYGIWKDRYRYPRYLEPDEDEEDDESTEEIFSRPSTSKQNIVPLKTKKPKEIPFDDIDISTDFKSILDNTNGK